METSMFHKSKITLVAALVLGSASAALAQSSGEEIQNSAYQLNPNAPVPVYAESMRHPATLIEGRNVAVQTVHAPAKPFNGRYESFGGY
jgi:hypothetical protein